MGLIESFVPAAVREAYDRRGGLAAGGSELGDHGAVLWCDMVNFTPLSRRLVAAGPQGVQQLSRLLDQHFDAIIEQVAAFGGDATEFFGDALLSIFHCDEDGLPDSVRRAAACAAALLASYDLVDDQGAAIRLHVHLAAGPVVLHELPASTGEYLFTSTGLALDDLSGIANDRAPHHLISSALAAGAAGLRVLEALPHGGKLIDLASLPPSSAPAPSLPDVPDRDGLLPYVPQPVAHRIDIGELHWGAELRRITSVFIGLPDSGTDGVWVRAIVELAQGAAHRFHGIVHQVSVDEKGMAIVMLFGIPPLAHQDDQVHAVRCAMTVAAGLRDRQQACRIGIATGESFAGTIGNARRRRYAVIGDAINLSSRLMHSSDGQILCDEMTVDGAERSLSFRPEEPRRVKGRHDLVWVWVPETDPGTPRMPIFGREEILQTLSSQIDAAPTGGARMQLIIGDAGLGKSTLLEILAERAQAAGLRVLSSAASRLGDAVPFHALRPLFESLFGLDAMPEQDRHAEHVLAQLNARQRPLAGLLNAVMPLDLPGAAQLAVIPAEQRQQQLSALLLQLLQAAEARQGLAILIEDAHWLDDASLQLLRQLSAQLQRSAVFVTARPMSGDDPVLALGNAGAHLVELGPLDRAAQRELICAALNVDEVETAVLELIAEKSEGNPFYASELARHLELNGLVLISGAQATLMPGVRLEQVRLPDSIRVAITGRIDRMDAPPQLTLKVQSVIGIRGLLDTVAAVHPAKVPPQGIRFHVDYESRLGLVRRLRVAGREGFEFDHVITHDVAYDLLLPHQRSELHAATAAWLEQAHNRDLSPLLADLAHHWRQAGELGKAADYLVHQAWHVFSTGFPREAVGIGLSAGELLGLTMPASEQDIGPLIQQTMQQIGRRTARRQPMDLLALPALDDPVIDRQLMFLVQVAPLVFQADRTDLYALLTLQALRLTLENGNGRAAPQVYSMYSVVLGGMTGDRLTAHSWSELALALDRQQGGAMQAEVGFVHGWFHSHWQRPLRESVDAALSDAAAGLASGNPSFGCFSLAAAVIYLTAAGRPLDDVLRMGAAHLEQVGEQVYNAAFHIKHELQFAKALAGATRDPLSLSDEQIDEETELTSILQTGFSNQIAYYLVLKLKLHAHFGDWNRALEFARQADMMRPAFAGQTAEFELDQYQALAAAGNLLEGAALAADELPDAIGRFRAWAGPCPANFAHKLQLLEAVQAGLAGNLDDALALFDTAAQAAADQGFCHDALLAREWAARLCLRAGRLDETEQALTAAAEMATAWGAHAKRRYLQSLATAAGRD